MFSLIFKVLKSNNTRLLRNIMPLNIFNDTSYSIHFCSPKTLKPKPLKK